MIISRQSLGLWKSLLARRAPAFTRLFTSSALRHQELDRPEVPKQAKARSTFLTSNLDVTNYELDRLRIVPTLKTFYGGNPVHDDILNQLNAMIARHEKLPTRTLDAAEVNAFKFLSFEEYKELTQSGTRLKTGHHKAFLEALHRLRSINPELMPVEVTETLEKYANKTGDVAKQALKKEKTLDQFGRAKAVGKRKRSVSSITMVRGAGEVIVNGKSFADYFPRFSDREKLAYPFKVVNQEGQYNIFVEAHGGGLSGQAEALMYGIAKALVIFNPLLKPRLRQAGLMTRDARKVERKKPGKVKARKSPTWVKR